NLDSANLSMTLLKEMNNGLAVGPIIIGLRAPAHILAPSVTSRGIVNMAAIAASEALTLKEMSGYVVSGAYCYRRMHDLRGFRTTDSSIIYLMRMVVGPGGGLDCGRRTPPGHPARWNLAPAMACRAPVLAHAETALCRSAAVRPCHPVPTSRGCRRPGERGE